MSTAAGSVSELVLRLVVFVVSHLRDRGLAVSSSEAIDAARGLALIDLTSQMQVRSALRTTLAKDAAAAAVLEQLLDQILPTQRSARHVPMAAGPGGPPPVPRTLARAIHDGDTTRMQDLTDKAIDTFAGLPEVDTDGTRSVRHHTARVLRCIGLDGLLRQLLALRRDEADGPRSEVERRLAAAEAEAAVRALADMIEKMITERTKVPALVPPTSEAVELADLPILTAAADELDALRRAVHPLARRITARLGRRRRRGHGSLDMRRTIRASMSSGGVTLTPALHRRRPVRPDLAVLCDVSGSVAQFAPFTLALLHALS